MAERILVARLALVVVDMGCNQTVNPSISDDSLGTEYANLEGDFGAVDMVEEVPGDIRHGAIIDEASLSSEPSCRSGAEEGEAVAVDEVIRVYDHGCGV